MVCKAWRYHEDGTSKHALHQHNPVQMVSDAELRSLGVLYFHLDQLDKDPALEKLRTERGYTNFDVVNITAETPKEKLDTFFDEHLHEDEEIRLCLAGSGFFDMRSRGDDWIRIHCQPGDLLIMPAGIYHRFTLDEGMNIRAMRLFTSAPKWIALSRSEAATDKVPTRGEYLASLGPEPDHAVSTCATCPASSSSASASSSSSSSSSSVNGAPIIINDGPQALANYPHARVARGLIYLSGFSSRREDNTHRGATLDPATQTWTLDIEEQTCGVIENMQKVLRAAGADLSHLLDVTVFLTDMKHYAGFNRAYNKYFNAATGPSRTTVAVHQLPHPNLLIEIKGVAQAP